MQQWHNREKAAASTKATNLRKRQERFAALRPTCKVCGSLLTFEQFAAGRRDLCPAKGCRSSINRANSLKQDKTKISEYIRNSEKWKESQREALLKKRSRIEECYHKIFQSMFNDVRCQVLVRLPNNRLRFADFVVNGVIVEIDGPYHTEQGNAVLNEFCASNDIMIIRIDVTRHWTQLFAEIGDIVQKIRAVSSAERASALQAEGRRFDPDTVHQS